MCILDQELEQCSCAIGLSIQLLAVQQLCFSNVIDEAFYMLIRAHLLLMFLHLPTWFICLHR